MDDGLLNSISTPEGCSDLPRLYAEFLKFDHEKPGALRSLSLLLFAWKQEVSAALVELEVR